MSDVLYIQLQQERDTRDKLISTGRTDVIATLLLQRIEFEIIKIEEQINGKGCKKRSNNRSTGGFMADVFKALYRPRDIKNRGDNTIFTVSKGAEQQVPEVAK